jgi:hypothetical protein
MNRNMMKQHASEEKVTVKMHLSQERGRTTTRKYCVVNFSAHTQKWLFFIFPGFFIKPSLSSH